VAGVVALYREYREYLKQQKQQIAPLQLLGRIEDYLTKEFAGVILRSQESSVLPVLNVGKKKEERRIDLALVKGDLSDGVNKKELTVWGLVEVKYLRNRHRFGKANAEDEHEPTLRSLHKQLRRLESTDSYADYAMKLRSGKRDTYGIVFASFVDRENEEDGAVNGDQFRHKIIQKAKAHGFRTSNFKTPRFYPLYEDYPVTLLGGKYRVSLHIGLWRLDADAGCDCGCAV
jgi:hypothetical protein